MFALSFSNINDLKRESIFEIRLSEMVFGGEWEESTYTKGII